MTTLLALHVREIVQAGASGVFRDLAADVGLAPPLPLRQEIERFAQRRDGVHLQPVHDGRLGGVDSGTIIARAPSSAALTAIGSTPRTGRTAPSSAEFADDHDLVQHVLRDERPVAAVAARRPSAIGRSNAEPSLRTSAGARLIVMAPRGPGGRCW